MSFVGNFCATSLIADTILTMLKCEKCVRHSWSIAAARFSPSSAEVSLLRRASSRFIKAHVSRLRWLFARRVCVSLAVVIIPLPSGRFSLHAIALPPTVTSRA